MKTLRLGLIILAIAIMFPIISHAEQGPVDVASNTTKTERIEQAKQLFPIRLSEQEKTILARRCMRAQTNLTKISAKLEARELIITKKYSLINLHLTAVQKRLALKQVDTSIIDLLLTNYQKLSSEHQTAFDNYQLALDDATTMDCAADPQAFKVLIEDVRAKRQAFVSSIENIKNFSTDDLKTSFDALRTRLNSRNTEE